VHVAVDCEGIAEFITNTEAATFQLAAPEFLYFVASSNRINPIASIDPGAIGGITSPSGGYITVQQ
jgi:hypothetical protein